jgi:hypothetical protein
MMTRFGEALLLVLVYFLVVLLAAFAAIGWVVVTVIECFQDAWEAMHTESH